MTSVTEHTDHANHPDYADHSAIGLLVSRFFRSLDVREIDEEWAREYFTEDVRERTPIGDNEGRNAVLRHTVEALGRFARTQHIATDVMSEVAEGGAVAAVSWNALMTHVHHDGTLFTVGGHCRAEVRRTPEGWRFRDTAIEVVWTRGKPPADVGGQAE
ncbi:nuclear transport factor 2 family protein [Streptomyces sp. NPDC058086]|uniref:nuclear transport factor 2 family protein n=1 Tax=Streptomyces sp. NPDC058086 TaxID=3346334 RepID=UPI0036F1486B